MDLARHKDMCMEIVENSNKEFSIERSMNEVIKVRIFELSKQNIYVLKLGKLLLFFVLPSLHLISCRFNSRSILFIGISKIRYC